MLRRLSVRFDPIEDRLLLCLALATPSGVAEHWLHLTRRTCAVWLRDLQVMVDLSAQVPERLDRAAKAALASAHHEAMSSQVARRTESETSPPPSDRPVALVTRVICGRRRRDARWVVTFELRNEPALILVLSSPTLHGLVDALARRIEVARWGLPALAAVGAPAGAAVRGALH